MQHRKFIATSFMTFSVFLLMACNPSGSVGSGNSTPSSGESTLAAPTAESTAVPAPISSGSCTNPLYPVAAGVTWDYTLSGTVNDTFVRKINSVDMSGFEDQDTFSTGVTRTGEWKCDNGALIALDPSGGSSANVQLSTASGDFTTSSMSGVTLPATINAGDTWSQSTTLEGTVTFNARQADATNDFTNDCTANGNEDISVAAGNFNAMKVTCQTHMVITITIEGASVPTTIDINTISWYAPGVGLVKALSTGNDFDTTTELTSYVIP